MSTEPVPVVDPEAITVKTAAQKLSVSETWIRRHIAELPVIRAGGLIRFNARLLSEMISGTMQRGKSLEPKEPIMVNRFQRGSWKIRGKNKMVVGRFRLETLNAKGERKFAVTDENGNNVKATYTDADFWRPANVYDQENNEITVKLSLSAEPNVTPVSAPNGLVVLVGEYL